VVFPLVFKFLTGMAPEGVAVMTDISHYLDFVLTLFFAFGFAFEIPIATILLVWMGMTTPKKLSGKRPYVIVGAFVVGMLLTPPDVISQTLLALPMWVLFEAGIIFSRFFVRRKDDEDETEEGEEGGDSPEPAVGASVATAPVHTQSQETGFTPLTEDEMEAELDRLEAELDDEEASWHEEEEEQQPEPVAQREADDPVDRKLLRINTLREDMDFDAARKLLYEVLVEGNDDQIVVAKNILSQLDD
jgi:sec-independent protein translocase protein TatC